MKFGSTRPLLPTSEGFCSQSANASPRLGDIFQQIGYVLASLDIGRAPFIKGTAFADEMEAYRLRFLLDV